MKKIGVIAIVLLFIGAGLTISASAAKNNSCVSYTEGIDTYVYTITDEYTYLCVTTNYQNTTIITIYIDLDGDGDWDYVCITFLDNEGCMYQRVIAEDLDNDDFFDVYGNYFYFYQERSYILYDLDGDGRADLRRTCGPDGEFGTDDDVYTNLENGHSLLQPLPNQNNFPPVTPPRRRT